MTNSTATVLLRIAGALWVIWGFVHAFAGVMTINLPTGDAVQGIADAVPAGEILGSYHAAVGAVVNQHGWNLLWGGIVTLVCGILMFRNNDTAIWLAALVGGLLDIGYFVFLDLGDFVNFVPGTVMTLVSGTAILISASVVFARYRANALPQSSLKDRLS
ncbi:MAG: hypothetical protein AAF004_08165 [Pseudomonadota bacterium]